MKVPVCRNGVSIGTVSISEQGGWTEIGMACREDNSGLFRGFLVCGNGEIPVGVLVPDNGELHASRRIPTAEFKAFGPVRFGGCRLSYSFETEEDDWKILTDEFFHKNFRGSLRHTEETLWRETEKGRELALLWTCGKPFPLMELFCFVRVKPVRGRLYAVISFNRKEFPEMPQ